MSQAPTLPGQVVDGYRIERIVSTRGGFQALADATAPNGEPATLELTPPATDREARRRARKLRRVRAAIHHPNLLPVAGGRKRRGPVCLEAPPGRTEALVDCLGRGVLEPKLAVCLLSEVAGALEAARARGLVHRGLTSAAILVTRDGPPKALLAGFGTSMPDAPAGESPAAVEALDYRSPEEIRGEAPTPQSNVYSLACILVECLTGAPPFPADRPLLTLHAHLTAEPPRLSKRRSELTPELDAVVAEAMSKNPRRRHHSAGMFMRAVQAALELETPIPLAVDPIPKPPRKKMPARAPAPAPAPAAAPPSARPRRRLPAARALAPGWIGVALLASALAGFATGNTDADNAPAPASGPRTETSAAGTAVVAPAVEQLDARRAILRRRLREADRPGRQAALARRLATVYGGARAALGPAAARSGPERALAQRLAAVQLAYTDLAAAARRQRSGAWSAARAKVLERERDLELLLRTRRWS
jgi:hypothetical protein